MIAKPTYPLTHPIALGLTDARAFSRSGSVPPVNSVAPALSGFAFPQETLSTSNGTWTGTPAPTYSYQWYVNSVARSGATASTFQPGIQDIGLPIYCRVTATNSAGSQATNSNTVTCWHPNQISGVVRFWSSLSNVLNSVSPDVAATNGQTVRRWNGIISTTPSDQTTGINQPIYRATGQSGNPSIEFDGSNDALSPPNNSPVLQNVSQAYLIAGARDTNHKAGSGNHPILWYSNNSTGVRLGVYTRISSTNVFSAAARRLDADSGTLASNASNSNYNVLTAHGDYSNGFVRLRVNGSLVASTALPGSGSTSNTPSAANFIGSDGFNWMPGYVTSACVVNTSITATELSQLERYIGLFGNLNIPLV